MNHTRLVTCEEHERAVRVIDLARLEGSSSCGETGLSALEILFEGRMHGRKATL